MLLPRPRSPSLAPRLEAALATAYVGLGSNLGDRLATLRSALSQLQALPGTALTRASPAFETRPLGPATGNFLNAVVELRTTLTPLALLNHLLAIEVQHGRTRHERWSSRTLDLDLLAFTLGEHSLRLTSPRLQLPHPELMRRDFVLAPLHALRPDFRPHGTTSVHELLAALPAEDRTILAQVGAPLC